MGWPSFLEDIMDRYYELRRLGNEIKESIEIKNYSLVEGKIAALQNQVELIMDKLCKLEDFLTDPANSTTIHALDNFLAKCDAEKEVGKYQQVSESKEQTIRGLRSIIVEHEGTIKTLEMELKTLKKRNQDNENRINSLYNRHPEIGYEDFDNPGHKANN